jgi:hypothetical protein
MLGKRNRTALRADSAGHRRIDKGFCRSVPLICQERHQTPAYSATVSGGKFSPATSDKLKSGHRRKSSEYLTA